MRAQDPVAGRAIPAGWLAALLVTALAAMLYSGARENSVTVDEMAHLPAGLVYLTSGRFATYHHNPPLVRMLAAIPVTAAGIAVPAAADIDDRWRLGMAFQRALGSSYHAVFLRSRMVIAAITCATAMLLFAASRRASGDAVALVALTLFCFSPTVLAHGALVTTDAGFMLAFLATVCSTVAAIRAPTWRRSLGLGTVLGLAQLTKFTALLLYPVVIAIAVLATLPRDGWAQPWARLAGRARVARMVVVVALSLLWLNAGYLFQGSGLSLAQYRLGDSRLAALAASPLGSVPLPLPGDYILGFDAQAQEASGRFEVYLGGQRSRAGWWYYYPLALLYKEPAPLFVLLAAVVGLGAARRLPLSAVLMGSSAITVACFVAFVAGTNVDLGVRYLLFLLPLLHFIAAHVASPPFTRGRRLVVGACLAWYAASSLRAYPDYLSYFSEAVGGVERGHEYLADSNLDWGQDLLRLRAWMAERGVESVALSHYGLVDPGSYGIAYEPLGPSPVSDRVVISANHLLGIDPWAGGAMYVAPYRDLVPRERIGATLWVFDTIRGVSTPLPPAAGASPPPRATPPR